MSYDAGFLTRTNLSRDSLLYLGFKFYTSRTLKRAQWLRHRNVAEFLIWRFSKTTRQLLGLSPFVCLRQTPHGDWFCNCCLLSCVIWHLMTEPGSPRSGSHFRKDPMTLSLWRWGGLVKIAGRTLTPKTSVNDHHKFHNHFECHHHWRGLLLLSVHRISLLNGCLILSMQGPRVNCLVYVAIFRKSRIR